MISFDQFAQNFTSTCTINAGAILPYEFSRPLWSFCVSAEAEAWGKGYETAIRTVVAILREQSAEAIAAKVDFSPVAWESLANRLDKMK